AMKSGAANSSSSPVYAATTPGSSRAFDTSIPLIRACANGLRTSPTQSIPGRLMLSTYLARPVISSASSLRSWLVPTNLVVDSVTVISPSSRARDGLHGLDDVVVAGAPAEVPLEPVADLVVARVRMLVQEARGRHDHPRRAIAALQGMVLVERLLHGMERAVPRQSLDRRHLVTVGLHGEEGARLHGLSVQVDSASPTRRRVATDVGAGETELLAQRIDEELPGLDVELPADTVDGDRDASQGAPFSRGPGRIRRSRVSAPRTAASNRESPETGFCSRTRDAPRSSLAEELPSS